MGKLKEKYNSMSIQVKAAFWYLVCSLTQKGIAIITTPIFTRLMNTAQYGEFNVYSSWKEIVLILCTLRLSHGVVGPGLVKNEDDRAAFSSCMYTLTTVLVLIWGFLFFIFNKQLQSITELSSLILFVMLVHVWTQAVWEIWAKEQRVLFRYRALVLITIIVAVIRPIIGIIVVKHAEDKAVARIIEMTAVDFAAYIGLFVLSLYRGKRLYSKKYWIYALTINIPLIPHFLSQTILNSADRIMIERMVDSSSAGIYSLAYSISVITVFLNNAMLQAMSPWTYRKLKDRNENDIQKVGFTALIIIAAINLLFIAFAPELVCVFAPTQYHEAIWIVSPIAMSVFFQFSYLLFVDIELYFERTKLIAFSTSLGAILNVVLNYIFINFFGYYAAGYTTLFCYIFIAIVHYLAMIKVCKMNLDGNIVYSMHTWVSFSLAFLLVGFLLLASYTNTILRIIIITGIVGICFAYRKRIISIIKLISRSKNSFSSK